MALSRYFLSLLVILAVSVTVSAQEALFSDDFEWGDTGDWSNSEPPRCDRVEAFGRGLNPTSEIHVATWGDMDGFCYEEPPSRGAFEVR
jgi:hypothetical protein